MVDSQFIESRNFQLREVAGAFDVPPYKLATEGETEAPAMVQQAVNIAPLGRCRWRPVVLVIRGAIRPGFPAREAMAIRTGIQQMIRRRVRECDPTVRLSP
jgi:hypothetical protein